MELEHPDITRTLLTGYPSQPEEPVLTCDWCLEGIFEGEAYYVLDGEAVCEKCVREMRRLA